MSSGMFWPVTAIIAFVALVAYVAHEDHLRWEKFARENDCKVVATISDGIGTGIGMDAKGNPTLTTVYVPEKKGWKCNNGHTYFR